MDVVEALFNKPTFTYLQCESILMKNFSGENKWTRKVVVK